MNWSRTRLAMSKTYLLTWLQPHSDVAQSCPWVRVMPQARHSKGWDHWRVKDRPYLSYLQSVTKFMWAWWMLSQISFLVTSFTCLLDLSLPSLVALTLHFQLSWLGVLLYTVGLVLRCDKWKLWVCFERAKLNTCSVLHMQQCKYADCLQILEIQCFYSIRGMCWAPEQDCWLE